HPAEDTRRSGTEDSGTNDHGLGEHAPGEGRTEHTRDDVRAERASEEGRAGRAAVETSVAVAESGGTRIQDDEDLPTAENFPFAPRTLTRAMARRAAQLGLQLPKPRLRGMLHLIAFPTTVVIGLGLVALGETLSIRLACALFV